MNGDRLPEWKVLWMYPRARMGDPIAFEALSESVYYLAVAYAHKYCSGELPMDYMIQEGMYGFVCGVMNGRWNPRRGSWSTYITYYIRGRMQMSVGRERGLIRIPRGCECRVRYIEEMEGLDVVDDSGDYNISLDDRDRHKSIVDAMRVLDSRSRDILTLRTSGDMTLQSVANLYGLSEERVRQLQKLAVRKVRKVLNLAVESE